jgi:hypothetical protein
MDHKDHPGRSDHQYKKISQDELKAWEIVEE